MKFMGLTEHGRFTHIVEVITGWETRALCGVKVSRFVENDIGQPVRFAAHWDDAGMCQSCIAAWDDGV